MEIQDLNDLANDVTVARLTIADAQKRMEEIISSNPEIQALEAIISSSKMQMDEAQDKLIEAMSANELKSWKTEQANFARTKRSTVSIDPTYKKAVEVKLKSGEAVEGFELRETEYLSVKLNK